MNTAVGNTPKKRMTKGDYVGETMFNALTVCMLFPVCVFLRRAKIKYEKISFLFAQTTNTRSAQKNYRFKEVKG